MARSSLFAAVSGAFRLAASGVDRRASAADEALARQAEGGWNRRRFLRRASAGGLMWGGAIRATSAAGDGVRQRATGPRVAIVGAGLSGLTVADRLAHAGLPALVYEAADRCGGRVLTARDVIAPGLATDLGAEFVDSSHSAARRLARALAVPLVDTEDADDPDLLFNTYVFGGRHRTQAQVVDALKPVAARILKDRGKLAKVIDARHEGGATALDRTSIAEYLDAIAVDGWVRTLLEVTWATEFGLDADRQSALNLILNVDGVDANSPYPLFEGHDERFKIEGGSSRLVEALAARVPGQVRLGHRLEAIHRDAAGLVLTFARPGGGAIAVAADLAVICLPFSTLRAVDLRVELPPEKRASIAGLGYGTNAKLVLGCRRPTWRDRGYAGRLTTDAPFQAAWDSGSRDAAGPAALTLFCGGRAGVATEAGGAADRVAPFLPGVESAYPGTSAALTAKVARSEWVGSPLALGSYACYLPGQWTTIGGVEAEPAGPLFFAGEHCGGEFQGYMEGAIRSGLDAARAVLDAGGGDSRRR